MINIKDEEKLQMLVDNQSELSYRELTNFLELPYLRGNSKDKQLSELSKICKIEKDKTKYKIPLGRYVVNDIKVEHERDLIKKTLTCYDLLYKLSENAANWYTSYMYAHSSLRGGAI